ncbi:hypothetical protein C1H57_25330, partial [Clostridium sp. 2-1]
PFLFGKDLYFQQRHAKGALRIVLRGIPHIKGGGARCRVGFRGDFVAPDIRHKEPVPVGIVQHHAHDRHQRVVRGVVPLPVGHVGRILGGHAAVPRQQCDKGNFNNFVAVDVL